MRCWRPRCRFVSPATWRILSFESTQSWWSIGPPVILIESLRAVSLEATSCPLAGLGRLAQRRWDEADTGCPDCTLRAVSGGTFRSGNGSAPRRARIDHVANWDALRMALPGGSQRQ